MKPIAPDVAQTCYSMAYFLLPQYVQQRLEVLEQQLKLGPAGAVFFYVMTCSMKKKQPDQEALAAFNARHGALDADHDYFLIEYPRAAPVQLLEDDFEKMMEAMERIVLAPYFSAIVKSRADGTVRYFILGQSPDGGTTLRSVSGTMNANMGPGCEPEADQFLELLRTTAAALPKPAAAKMEWQVWK